MTELPAAEYYATTEDELWPRVPEFRYRIYGRIGHRLSVLACAPDAGGVGMALVTMHEDQKQIGERLADLGQIGVLDAINREWVLLPWSRPS